MPIKLALNWLHTANGLLLQLLQAKEHAREDKANIQLQRFHRAITITFNTI